MYVIVPQEKRTSSYWKMSWGLRTYMRVVYAMSAALYASALMSFLPIQFVTQCAVVGVISAYILMFRTIHPNGFGLMEKFKSQQAQAKKELADGNMDGVPPFLQNVMHYPTKEEMEKRQQDYDKQVKDWKEYKAARKSERNARKANRKKK